MLSYKNKLWSVYQAINFSNVTIHDVSCIGCKLFTVDIERKSHSFQFEGGGAHEDMK